MSKEEKIADKICLPENLQELSNQKDVTPKKDIITNSSINEHTLLPSHRPLYEKVLDMAGDKLLNKLPVGEININPETCNEALLPLLAACYFVDISDLDTGQVRKLLKNALKLNICKGTVASVENAAKAVYPESDIVTYEDLPYQFGVKLALNKDSDLSAQNHDRLFKVVENSKNVRSTLRRVEFDMPESCVNIQSTVVLDVGGKVEPEFNLNTSVNVSSGSVFNVGGKVEPKFNVNAPVNISAGIVFKI